jgi:hypothetical protein
MTATNPEPPFAEFSRLVRALPPERRAKFDHAMANIKAGMPAREAARGYLVAIGTPKDEIEVHLAPLKGKRPGRMGQKHPARPDPARKDRFR